MLRHPLVSDVGGTRCVGRGSVQMKWQECSNWRVRCICRIGLLECRTPLGEAANATVTSKIVVERPVLLNQNDDVLDARHFGAGKRWSAKRTSTAALQSQRIELRGSRSGSKVQQFSTVQTPHSAPSR